MSGGFGYPTIASETEFERLVRLAWRDFPDRCWYCFATSLDLYGWPQGRNEFGPYAVCTTCTSTDQQTEEIAA